MLQAQMALHCYTYKYDIYNIYKNKKSNYYC